MKHLRTIYLFAICAAPLHALANTDLKTRLLAGEVQLLAQQQQYFDALLRIDGVQAVSQQSLKRALQQFHGANDSGDDESSKHLTLADIELGYRLSQRAGSAIRAVLNEKISQQQRNRAAYQLAQIYYDKQQYENAQYALQLVRGELFYPFSHDVKYLQAKINAHLGEFDDAIAVFEKLQYDDRFKGFAAYNLAHALMADGQLRTGLHKLAQLGDMDAHDDVVLSLRDKANLILGYDALKSELPREALIYLGKVRQQGPFSNKALLGIAWANMALNDTRAALAAWNELHTRHPENAAVQEAWLGLPYSYGKLGSYSKAIELYESAITKYENSLKHIQAAVESIQGGEFFEQLRQRDIPATDEGILSLRQIQPVVWLDELLTQPGFQLAMKNTIEANQMLSRLQQWQRTAESLQSLLALREQYAGKVSADARAELEKLEHQLADTSLQRDMLADMIATITPDNNMELLASNTEQTVLASLQQIRHASDALSEEQAENLLQRVKRVRGVIDWQIAQQYQQRRDAMSAEMQSLDNLLDELRHKRDRIERRLQRVENVSVYKVPLFNIKKEIAALDNRLNQFADRQQSNLKKMMLQALQKRQRLVGQYLATARYELAKNYDLVTEQQRQGSPN